MSGMTNIMDKICFESSLFVYGGKVISLLFQSCLLNTTESRKKDQQQTTAKKENENEGGNYCMKKRLQLFDDQF